MPNPRSVVKNIVKGGGKSVAKRAFPKGMSLVPAKAVRSNLSRIGHEGSSAIVNREDRVNKSKLSHENSPAYKRVMALYDKAVKESEGEGVFSYDDLIDSATNTSTDPLLMYLKGPEETDKAFIGALIMSAEDASTISNQDPISAKTKPAVLDFVKDLKDKPRSLVEWKVKALSMASSVSMIAPYISRIRDASVKSLINASVDFLSRGNTINDPLLNDIIYEGASFAKDYLSTPEMTQLRVDRGAKRERPSFSSIDIISPKDSLKVRALGVVTVPDMQVKISSAQPRRFNAGMSNEEYLYNLFSTSLHENIHVGTHGEEVPNDVVSSFVDDFDRVSSHHGKDEVDQQDYSYLTNPAELIARVGELRAYFGVNDKEMTEDDLLFIVDELSKGKTSINSDLSKVMKTKDVIGEDGKLMQKLDTESIFKALRFLSITGVGGYLFNSLTSGNSKDI